MCHLRRFLLLGRRGPFRPDRLDLNLGQLAPEAGVAAIPRAAAVLSDPNLLALDVRQDLRRDRLALRRELGFSVAALEDDIGLERLLLVHVEAVHEQLLALADDVLLATELDDRVTGHGNAGLRPRGSVSLPAVFRHPRPFQPRRFWPPRACAAGGRLGCRAVSASSSAGCRRSSRRCHWPRQRRAED